MGAAMSDADPVVLINVYRCEPGKQAALMDLLSASLKAQRELDGFISATVHRGLNGRVAAVHAVWRSRDDWKAMARHPSVAAAMEPVLALATFEPHLYEPGEVIE